MNTTAINVTPHLLRNEEGVILCGAQNHYDKRPKAKVVELSLRRPSQRTQPDEGTYVLARDGNKVSIGSAYCGTHKPSSPSVPVLDAAMVASFRDHTDLLLDYAKRYYEARLDEAEARAAELAAYHAARMKEESEATFVTTATYDWGVEDYGNVAEWTLTNPDGRQVTVARLMLDGGQLRFSYSDFSGNAVGTGRGSLNWMLAMREVLDEAVAVTRLHDEGRTPTEGTGAPTDA